MNKVIKSIIYTFFLVFIVNASSLEEKYRNMMKIDATKEKKTSTQLDYNELQRLILKASHNIKNFKKGIFESTKEFEERKENKIKELEKEVEKILSKDALYEAGKATMKSYDADKEVMVLSLKWQKSLKNIFKVTFKKEFKLNISRMNAKKIFEKQYTHAFYIKSRFIDNKLKISEIYLYERDKKYLLVSEHFKKSKEVYKSISKTPSQSRRGWITPTNIICMRYGGQISNGVCKADWKEAKKICQKSGGRLPSIKVLEKELHACKGSRDKQECYQNRGFTSSYYWSSTSYQDFHNLAWIVNFYYGGSDSDNKHDSYFVRCVR